jgi:hypothetical protein
MASAFNMKDFMKELKETEESGIILADRVTRLKINAEIRHQSTPGFKAAPYTRKENAIMEQIAVIKADLTILQGRLVSIHQRRQRAAPNNANKMQIVEDDKVVRDTKHDIKKLSEKLDVLDKKFKENRTQRALAEKEAQRISKLDNELEREELKFKKRFGCHFDEVISGMEKQWNSGAPNPWTIHSTKRSESTKPNESRNRDKNPKPKPRSSSRSRSRSPERRPSGGATRRRHGKRKVTRRR